MRVEPAKYDHFRICECVGSVYDLWTFTVPTPLRSDFLLFQLLNESMVQNDVTYEHQKLYLAHWWDENVTALHETDFIIQRPGFTILLTHGLARSTSTHSLRKAEYRGAVFDSKVRRIDPFLSFID